MAGILVTIEGTEGAGKGAAVTFSKEFLAKRKVPVVWTREPGGTQLGERVRQLILTNDFAHPVTLSAELLLFFAARAQHLEEVIKPALAAGKIVVCDRFTDSSYAYQGFARGGDIELIKQLERVVQGDLRPKFTLLLKVPAEVGLARASKRGALDRIESEQIDFFKRVVAGYDQLIKLDRAKRFRIIDADCSLELVHRQLERFWQEVLEVYG